MISRSSCDQSCGSPQYVSQMGEGQIVAGEAQVVNIVCGDFETLGCGILPDCDIAAEPPACIAGRCGPQGATDPCADCGNLEAEWRAIGPGILPALIVPSLHSVIGCGMLTTTTQSMTCINSPASACDDTWRAWKVRLDELLANDEVQQAIREGGTYGEPEEYSGIVYEISVRGSTFRFRDCAGLSSRMCQPSGIRALLDHLELMTHPCPSSSDCTSPFDPGPTDGALPVFWHDALTRTCFPRVYGLTGGNQNRYMTLEECERACPPPVGPSDCAMDRTFVEARCLDCGPIGPCITPVPRCLASCDSDSDCEAEQAAVGRQVDCNNGLCELALFCL